MAADPLVFFNSFTEALGDNTIDLDDDTLRVALFTDSYAPNVATQSTFSALTGQVANGFGYATGGAQLANVTWTRSGAVATLDADDAAWTASGGNVTARYAVLYSATASTNNLIGYVLLDNTPGNVTVTDTNTLTVQWSASGIFTLAPA
jgi:hypothetical protein